MVTPVGGRDSIIELARAESYADASKPRRPWASGIDGNGSFDGSKTFGSRTKWGDLTDDVYRRQRDETGARASPAVPDAVPPSQRRKRCWRGSRRASSPTRSSSAHGPSFGDGSRPPRPWASGVDGSACASGSRTFGSSMSGATSATTLSAQAGRARAQLAELPDGDRIVAFDAYRAGSSPCGRRSRWPAQPSGRNSAGSSSSGSSCGTASWSPSTGRHRPDPSSRKDSGFAPKGIRTPDLHLERVAS